MDTVIDLTSAGTEWPTNSIFRAPAIFNKHGRKLSDRRDCEPQPVFIGPYHHEGFHGWHEKEVKLESMLDLMKKQGVGGSSIDDVPVKPFMKWESRARSFYAYEFPLTDVDFVRMLVLDSCYIIRIILNFSRGSQETMVFIDEGMNINFPPRRGNMYPGNIKYRRCDLLMLENQIPLFFIKEVYNWCFPCADNPRYPSFETILEPFISLDMPWKINRSGLSSGAAHLLELYWRCSLPTRLSFEHMQPSGAEIHRPINTPKVIASAIGLHQRAGIKFEVFNDKGLDVTFSNGIMRMPCLKVDLIQRSILLNLMAFENAKLPRMRIVNSYMKLIDVLINSKEDEYLLRNCGVVYITLSRDRFYRDGTSFYQDIGELCLIDYNAFLFSDLYENVRKYYNSDWNRTWTSLQHDHLNSPGKVIKTFVGGSLLILAALQTYYTIYDH